MVRVWGMPKLKKDYISDKGLAIKELVNIPGFWTENETFELSWIVGPGF